MIQIRKAKPTDATAIAPIMNLAMADITQQFVGDYDTDAALAFLAHFIQLPENQYSYENIYVAVEEDEILGQISLYPGADLHQLRKPVLEKMKLDYGVTFPIDDETEAGEIYIDTIAVTPAAQGKGVGKQLLAYVKHLYATERGETLGLLVDKGNPNAKRLYVKEGFIVVNEKNFMGTQMEHMQYSVSL
ncbi:GNAT family N-acetyltransferase [Sphingobacterium sp. Mn56C]|uniref:GNAT family N-acetyltransferase n=1 Tax=Sphingobacterium sp. Mn56C TaxID=3395261 RepID=UPI003BE13E62